jgi:hypothetical protein
MDSGCTGCSSTMASRTTSLMQRVSRSREARALLKDRFDYPVFLYEAEKVGITATGEPDASELYPNDRLPAGLKWEDTCLAPTQEQERRLDARPGGIEGFLRQAGDGQDAGAVLTKLANVGQGRIVENAFG